MERAKLIYLLCIIIIPITISFFYSSFPFHQYFLNRHVTSPLHVSESVSTSRHQVYIVRVTQPHEGFLSAKHRENWHKSFLPTTQLDSGKPRLVYSYVDVIDGFAARLTAEEAKAMESKDGFLGAHVSEESTLDTTYSPLFLRLQEGKGLWQSTNYGAGVIVGVIDTGVNPNHVSFGDKDVPKPPEPKKEGHKRPCSFETKFTCNNKIIGAIGFSDGDEIPADDENGHGTHCGSVAAGNFVNNANFLGNAKGRASGIAPHAHLMIYKVWGDTYNDADILRAIDQAFIDEVDVLSISISRKKRLPFYDDIYAIAYFRAMDKGIFVSTSASNNGPDEGSVFNTFPWVLTVGASTIDRTLLATVNFKSVKLIGLSAYTKGLVLSDLQLAYPGRGGDTKAMTCEEGSLGKSDIKGKIVICHFGGISSAIDKGVLLLKRKVAAMLLVTTDERKQNDAKAHVLPAVELAYAESKIILDHVKAQGAKATLKFQGDTRGIPISPMVARFSGRGPAPEDIGILKPDIIGPGVDILAASPFKVGPSGHDPPLNGAFTVVSGTSFSTPHLAGVGALLKASHSHSQHEWSPAVIKSAIMTSSSTENRKHEKILDQFGNEKAGLFAMGAGHVEPMKADTPGLVYDIETIGYVNYLCGLPDYTPQLVEMVVGKSVTCPETKVTPQDLNYPSIAVNMGSGATTKVKRTVRNVGEATSKYELKIAPGVTGIEVTILPDSISFTGVNEEQSYTLEFTATAEKGAVVEAQLELSSGSSIVRTPISVTII